MSEGKGRDIEVPASTAWPMIAAFGVMLLFAGLVTIAAVSVVGLVLAVSGAIGWAREVYPHPLEERVPIVPASLQMPNPSPAVEKLGLGEEGHRVRFPVEIHPYSSGLWGGLAGGVAMAVVAILYGFSAYGSPFFPINLLASSLAPAMMNADPETLRGFHAGAFVTASIIHGVLSALAGLVYAVVLPMLPGRSILWGGVVAPILWSGVAWLALRIVNPTMDANINWAWFLASQVAYGLTCGFVVARTERVKTMQHWPLAVRAGVESPGLHSDDEGKA